MKNLLLTAFVLLFSMSLINAQEITETKSKNKKEEKLRIKIKDNGKPDVYVNGKKFNFSIELIDQSKIESVNVIKGELALKNYNAPNGVILIKTKEIKGSNNSIVTSKKKVSKKNPMVIIDGKVSDKKTLDKLSPNNIESINIIKDELAMKKYKAKNGVIVVRTKKK